MQTTITIYTDCTRCNGFRDAFKTFGHVAGGKCLLCNGGLPQDLHAPGVADQRASRVAGAGYPHGADGALPPSGRRTRDAQGRRGVDGGFDYHVTGDSWHVLGALFSRCDGQLRARGYAAIVAKIEALSATARRVKLLALRTAMSRATGIPVDAVDGWARGAEVRAAARGRNLPSQDGTVRRCDPR